jgi:hypothetical protein
MTAVRLKWNLKCIGWSPNELAVRLDINERTAQKWVAGKSFVPHRIAVWIEEVRAIVMAISKPLLWGEEPKPEIQDGIDRAWNNDYVRGPERHINAPGARRIVYPEDDDPLT